MAMLKNLGVSPNLLLGSGQDILEYTANQLFNIPCRGVFNDALVEISPNGQTIYLNCGSQFLLASNISSTILRISRSEHTAAVSGS